MNVYRVSRLRFLVQTIMLVCLVYLGVWGVRRLRIFDVEPSLPTLSCEYGEHVAKCYLYDLQSIATRDSQNYYRRLVEPTMFFAALGILIGRMWCGWACPLGFLQDLLTKLRCRLRLKKISFADRGRRVLRALAYALLAAALFIALVIGWPGSKLYKYNTALFRPYCQVCPSRQLVPLIEGKTADFLKIDRFSPVSRFMSYLSIGFLGVFVVGAFSSRRFWCRLCPLGAIMSVIRLNNFSLLGLKKDIISCTRCGVCARVCPMDLSRTYLERAKLGVLDRDCVFCLKCVESCPEERVLRATFATVPIFRSSYGYFSKRQSRLTEREAERQLALSRAVSPENEKSEVKENV